MVVLSLFSPWRYQLPSDVTSLGTYDIREFKNTYRNLAVLKNRHGMIGVEIPLYFKAETGTFIELPRPEDPKLINYKLSN